jgi:hypothetical protein
VTCRFALDLSIRERALTQGRPGSANGSEMPRETGEIRRRRIGSNCRAVFVEVETTHLGRRQGAQVILGLGSRLEPGLLQLLQRSGSHKDLFIQIIFSKPHAESIVQSSRTASRPRVIPALCRDDSRVSHCKENPWRASTAASASAAARTASAASWKKSTSPEKRGLLLERLMTAPPPTKLPGCRLVANKWMTSFWNGASGIWQLVLL